MHTRLHATAAPPTPQALAGAGAAVVRSLGSFDEWLESKKLLPVLERPIMDAGMVGSDGKMSDECKGVRGRAAGLRGRPARRCTAPEPPLVLALSHTTLTRCFLTHSSTHPPAPDPQADH
jgi:hypothetical protein